MFKETLAKKKIIMLKRCIRCKAEYKEETYLKEVIFNEKTKLWIVDHVEKEGQDFIPVEKKIFKKNEVYGPIGKYSGLDYYKNMPEVMYCPHCGKCLDKNNIIFEEERAD